MAITTYVDFRDYYDGVANRITYLFDFSGQNESNLDCQEIGRSLVHCAYPLALINEQNLFQWECSKNPTHTLFNNLHVIDKQIYALIYLAHHYGGLFLNANNLNLRSKRYFSQIEENVSLGIIASEVAAISSSKLNDRLPVLGSIYDCLYLIRRDTNLTYDLFKKTTDFLDYYDKSESVPPPALLLNAVFLSTIENYMEDIQCIQI